MNKKTRALTIEEFSLIIKTVKEGFLHNNINYKPNSRIAAALTLQANMGMRIGDIVELKLSNIIKDGSRLRLDIIEKKTGKKREFTVPTEIYLFLQNYIIENGMKPTQRLFPITTRQVNKHLKAVVDYLKLEGNISSHSFRKFYAVSIYEDGFNIELVRQLLQHSSVTTTQKYLSVSSKQVEEAISKHIVLPA